MDPDLNKYDLNHATTAHPLMSQAEWEGIYQEAWDTYYSQGHVERILRRAAATKNSVGKTLFIVNWFIGSTRIERIHPLECGFVRLKFRRDGRPGLPIEPAWRFYPRYWAESVTKQARWLWLWGRQYRLYHAIKKDPNRRSYMDDALTPVLDGDIGREMFNTDEAKAFVAREKHMAEVRAGAA